MALTLVTVGFERNRYTSSVVLEEDGSLAPDPFASLWIGFVNEAMDGLV